MTRATLLLCDHAQVADGKLFIAGGGWTITGPEPSPIGIAILLRLPMDQENTTHHISLQLFYRDGSPVVLGEDPASGPLEIQASFTLGKVHPDAILADEIDVPFATVLAPQPLPPGSKFEWRLFVDKETQPDWALHFSTRPSREETGTVQGSSP